MTPMLAVREWVTLRKKAEQLDIALYLTILFFIIETYVYMWPRNIFERYSFSKRMVKLIDIDE